MIDLKVYRLWSPKRPRRIVTRQICENLKSTDALYPLIRMELNKHLKDLGLNEYYGFPGWWGAPPNSPLLDNLSIDQPLGPRKYEFLGWFKQVLAACYQPINYVRIRKASSCGAPIYSKNIFDKELFLDAVVSDYSFVLEHPEIFLTDEASREQYNDKWGKIRKGSLYFEGIELEANFDPADATLRPFGLQKPRFRTPRMVSLAINYHMMSVVQSYNLPSYVASENLEPRISFATDPEILVKSINYWVNLGYNVVVSWDGKNQEWNTHEQSVLQTGKLVNLPLKDYISNWVYKVNQDYLRRYMGNPSGAAPVLLINIVETLSRLNYLNVITDKGVDPAFVVFVLGDTALLLCNSDSIMKDVEAKVKKEMEGLVELEVPAVIGHKEIVMTADGAVLNQDLSKLLNNFWCPEYDAGSSDRPFYGFGRVERWLSYIGNQTKLRDELWQFEDAIINRFNLRVLVKTPPAGVPAYDINEYYKLVDSGRRNLAQEIEPYVFMQRPIFIP